MAGFDGDDDEASEYITPDLFSGRDIFDLDMLFDALVLKRRREFQDARDPIFGCRTFVHDPAIGLPHVLPMVGGEVVGWLAPPSEKARALLNAPERRGRARIKTDRVTSEQSARRIVFEAFAAGLSDAPSPVEGRRRQPLPFSDDPYYAGFDDLEFEFLLRVGSIFSGISLSQTRTPFILLVTPEPKPRDLDRVQIPADWFGELVMVDFARGHLHELASLYPMNWRLRFSDVMGVKLSEYERLIAAAQMTAPVSPATLPLRPGDTAPVPGVRGTPATRRARQVSLSDAIEALIADRKLSADWFVPHGRKAEFVAELVQMSEFAPYRVSSVDRELRKVLARRWGDRFGPCRPLRPH
jgi:hypothetical protein